ncbi:MAG: hypothetical protein IRZ06_09615 [Nevskia sp.]|nr:hypothetical protein [Nevskia sp.]
MADSTQERVLASSVPGTRPPQPVSELKQLSLERHLGGPVALTVCLSALEHRHSQLGRWYARLLLDDASGCVPALVWSERLARCEALRVPAIVSVTGTVVAYGEQLQIRVEQVRGLEAHEVEIASRLLPRRHTPPAAHGALEALVAFHARLRPAVLSRFLDRVLLDPAIALPWLRCRASQRHHHAYPGGLLVHSVTPLDLVAHAVVQGGETDPDAIALTQVAYLLHDLGKLRTVGEERPPLGYGLRHEHQTLVLLEPHLAWLRGRWPQGAQVLDAVLDYCAQPANTRGFARLAAADAVIAADRLSAASERRRSVGWVIPGFAGSATTGVDRSRSAVA